MQRRCGHALATPTSQAMSEPHSVTVATAYSQIDPMVEKPTIELSFHLGSGFDATFDPGLEISTL